MYTYVWPYVLILFYYPKQRFSFLELSEYYISLSLLTFVWSHLLYSKFCSWIDLKHNINVVFIFHSSVLSFCLLAVVFYLLSVPNLLSAVCPSAYLFEILSSWKSLYCYIALTAHLVAYIHVARALSITCCGSFSFWGGFVCSITCNIYLLLFDGYVHIFCFLVVFLYLSTHSLLYIGLGDLEKQNQQILFHYHTLIYLVFDIVQAKHSQTAP